MKFRTLLLSLTLTAATLADAATPGAAPQQTTPIDQQFEQTVKPFVGKYCVACHSGKMAPARRRSAASH
jgi:cytochrome c1